MKWVSGLLDSISGNESSELSVTELSKHVVNKLTKPEELPYHELKSSLAGTGELFEDPVFQADAYSCFGSDEKQDDSVEWLRPPELLEKYHGMAGTDARMVVDGTSKFDLVQGELGDCWLVASIACITTKPGLLDQVMMSYVDFDSEDYFGCFAFNICVDGEWREVVVDDRLPSRNGELLFTSSTDKNEFWSALLEKAVAKVFGNYSELTTGSIEEGLSMLTGGITEKLSLGSEMTREEIEEKSAKMRSSLQRGSLLGCCIPADPEEGLEVSCDNGLVKGHAYSVTGLFDVEIRNSNVKNEVGKTLRLIRIRNPWGEKEWNGRWCDDSSEWGKLSELARQKLHVKNDDGEFYMQFEDFAATFTYVSMCHFQFQDSDDADVNDSNWFVQRIDGSWNLITAGGCKDGNFSNNHQYLIHIPELVDDDKCSIVFSLLQKNTRNCEASKHIIGLILFEITGINHPRNTPLPEKYFSDAKPAQPPMFNMRREVLMRIALPPGLYCVVASTVDEKNYGSYLLRTFTEHKIDLQPLDYRPKKTLRVDKLKIEEFGSESDVELMNQCLKRVAQKSQGSKIYAKTMTNALSLLVSADFLEESEEITIESCRSYIALITDNNGSPVITSADFASFLKLIVFLRKAFIAWVKHQYSSPKPPYSMDSLDLQEFLAHLGIFMPKKLLAKACGRYLNPNFQTGSDAEAKEVDFNGLLNIVLRILSSLDVLKSVKQSSSKQNAEKLAQMMDYMFSV